MTYSPFDPSSYDDEEQLKEYRAKANDGTYQGPNVEEGRPGPDGKVASTEAPSESKTEEPKEEPKERSLTGNPEEDARLQAEANSLDPFSVDNLKNVAQGAVTGPLGLIDFGMDVIGNLGPMGASVDDAWDQMTKFSNPNNQAARDMASVIVPTMAATMAAGPLGTKAAAAINGGKVAAGLATTGIAAGADVAVVGFSDYSERDTGMLRSLDDFLENIGRPMGLKIPQAVTVMDDDSPEVRQRKLMFEAAGLSIIGDALGYALSATKPIMGWFKPQDEVATEYFEMQRRINPDPDTVAETQKYRDEITASLEEMNAMKAAGEEVPKEAEAKLNFLIKQSDSMFNAYFDSGRTSATTDPLASFVQQQQASRSWQTDEVGAKKLQTNPDMTEFDPDVQSLIGDEASRPRQSIPRGNVARNAADTAAIRTGVSTGVPAPMITYPMLKEGLELDKTSRFVVRELVEESNKTGNYDAVVDGFRFSKERMKEAELDLFTEIVQARDVDKLREALLPYQYTKQIDEVFGVKQLNDSSIPQVGKAIKLLTKEFLGEDIAGMSARAINTTAKEINTYLDASKVFRGQADEAAIMDTVIEKLTFLAEEYGMAKFSAGWSLRNFKWWDRRPDTVKIVEEFTSFSKKNHDSALQFMNDLKTLKDTDPEQAKTLMLAYDATDGDVDSIVKLTAWTKQELSPMGLLRSKGNAGRNAFNEALWGVLYNNVLSGMSAGRAAVGAISSLALKPVDYLIGAGLRGTLKGDFSDLRKGLYAFGIEREVVGRALGQGWKTFKEASTNPEQFMEMIRKDHQYNRSLRAKFEVLDRQEAELLKKKDFGNLALLRWTKLNYMASMNGAMRFGTNLMLGIDAMSNYMVGTMVSKMNAWDEVYTVGQKLSPEGLLEAQRRHHDKVFDPRTDLIRNSWAKQQAQDIALNESTAFGNQLGALISKFPALQYAIMFPNTSINVMRKYMSYTPFSLLPNSNRYAKAIYARTPEQVDEVMLLHNIDINDPDKFRIAENLKNEYLGRVATGAIITTSLFQYGLQGNIRGNLPRDKKQRNFLLSQPGYKPKTIRINGNWVSYEGIIPLDPLLTIVGDISHYASDMSTPFKEDIVGKLTWTTTQAFAGQTPMSGLEPLVAALQGDETGLQRFITNSARMAVPMSGAQGVLARAITNANKEIYDDVQGYIASRIPGVNLTVPDKIDWWTGQKVNEIDNPMLRIFNAVNPIPVTAGEEPWRVWLNQSGLDLSSMILKDSTGTHTYTAQERALMSKFIGEQQIWKQVYGNGRTTGIMFNQKYNDQLDIVRAELATGKTFDELQPKTKDLPVIRRLTGLVKDAQAIAEQRMFELHPAIQQKITGARLAGQAMKAGDPSKAYSIAEKTQQQLKELEKFK